jgi:hypothetical protein
MTVCLVAVDPSLTPENRQLDAVEQPSSDRLRLAAFFLTQRGLIYDVPQIT